MSIAVAVVGSANLDLVAVAERAPEAGETVLGTDFVTVPGGKGANQAAAAAAVAPTALVGCVGPDAAGEALRAHLESRGVSTEFVETVDVHTGHALITVSADGENRIVVIPGANHALRAGSVASALGELAPRVVAAQLETGMASVVAAASWARTNGATFVLNPSPIQAVPAELLANTDVLIVNAGEARALVAGADVLSEADLEPLTHAELAIALLELVPTVVVTAGSDGAYVATRPASLAGVGAEAAASVPEAPTHVPAERVAAVDTTGAGDTFAGVLAASLALGVPLLDAARAATAESGRIVALPRDARG